MSTSEIVPQAECSVCHESFPLTSEFWYREKRKLSGFVSVCKSCWKIREQQRHKANPERRKANARRTYLRHQDEIKTRTNAYYWENHDQSLLRHQQYYEVHKDEILTKNKVWFDAHPEKSAEIKKSYIERNPERRKQSANEYGRSHKGRAARLRRRAREHALPDTFTPVEWTFCLDYWHGCCAYCGSQQDFWNVITSDHYIPLADTAHCPGTVRWNMIPACKHCNSSKQDRDPHDWLLEHYTPAQAAIIETRIAVYFALVSEKEMLT